MPFSLPSDYLSNVSNFKIIESTLREGEQFANAFFDTETKIRIAKALDDFGVEYIELTSPASSEQSRLDCEKICSLGLKAKILTHVRCNMQDAKIAVDTGVDGLDIVIGTSPQLMQHSHGKSMDYIRETALEVVQFVKSKGLEVRFSSEDSFRSDLVDLLNIYSAVDKIGVNRVGIAESGLFAAASEQTSKRISITSKLHEPPLAIEDLVADAVEVHIPFNNPVTGFCAFTHKAGIHAKAIIANPTTYEIINPADFGMTRYVHFTSRLTGWNAIKSRVSQLGLEMTDSQIKQCTTRIKAMADIRKLAIEDTDAIIHTFYENLYLGHGEEKPLLENMTPEERKKFAKKEAELSREPESKELDEVVEHQTDLLATNGIDSSNGVKTLNGEVAAAT
ncbi:hypothetical protein OEA41_000036 [Lepraria neglecta]|uniref:Homocitrate synthase n=1 Tax=Lepraria neglecta TaxID=209136 RepID=A0AAD9ZFI0_9LECA|nr:hypothetical protein OEA41_000036 [Lepraria neglecta]